MREFRRDDQVERPEPTDEPEAAYGAPVTGPDRPEIVRRHGSEIELPEGPDEGPIGGPASWARDAMDRAFSPHAIDHRHPVLVDHPELPERPPQHYDRPTIRHGDGWVDPPLFGADGPCREDVHQGELGDCWALSAMGAVAGHRPEAVTELVHEDADGFEVRLHHVRRDEGTGDWIPTGHRIELRVTREVPHLGEEPDKQVGASVADPKSCGRASWKRHWQEWTARGRSSVIGLSSMRPVGTRG
ncbi:MAG: hypothetical protein GEV11_29320 [Streptosporangiales bacterium]|nr:hypothetical protein [Streptosporangiales bacterium]